MSKKFWQIPNGLQLFILIAIGATTLSIWLGIGRSIIADEWIGGLCGVGLDLIFGFVIYLAFLTIYYFIGSDTKSKGNK